MDTCQHPACSCAVGDGDQYCSSACQRSAARKSSEECDCGHVDCAVEMADADPTGTL